MVCIRNDYSRYRCVKVCVISKVPLFFFFCPDLKLQVNSALRAQAAMTSFQDQSQQKQQELSAAGEEGHGTGVTRAYTQQEGNSRYSSDNVLSVHANCITGDTPAEIFNGKIEFLKYLNSWLVNVEGDGATSATITLDDVACTIEPNGNTELRSYNGRELLDIENIYELGCICGDTAPIFDGDDVNSDSGKSGDGASIQLQLQQFQGVTGFLSKADCGALRYFAKVSSVVSLLPYRKRRMNSYSLLLTCAFLLQTYCYVFLLQDIAERLRVKTYSTALPSFTFVSTGSFLGQTAHIAVAAALEVLGRESLVLAYAHDTFDSALSPAWEVLNDNKGITTMRSNLELFNKHVERNGMQGIVIPVVGELIMNSLFLT